MNNILNILNDSLNPSLATQTHDNIQKIKREQGFVPQLLIIADDTQYSLPIRQSALVILKNLIYDQCKVGQVVRDSDISIIKESILDALIRNGQQKKLTPTFRQIIHLLAEKDYPDRWPEIIPAIENNIRMSQDFRSVASSVQALKAIVSVCGRSAVNEITLNNLCNKIIEPLFMLTGKLFANFSSQILPILISVFKIFNLAMFFHLPNIITNNIHSLMIFIKQILEINSQQLNPLKVICLKILNRLYSRHTCSTVSFNLMQFAQNFHNSYSIPIFQTLIAQLLNTDSTKEMLGLSIASISCIYKNHDKSATVINQYKQKLIGICLQKYKETRTIKLDRINIIKEERQYFIELVESLFEESQNILGFLIEQYNDGDWNKKQLVLYIYSKLAQKIKQNPSLYENMRQFIINFILPNLEKNHQSIIRSRGCEIIAVYSFIQLPQESLQSIFSAVYTCLLQKNDNQLNVSAVSAFSQLINQYDKFLGYIIPYLSTILPIYTGLLKQSNVEAGPIMKNLQILLGKIDGKDIEPLAFDLIKFLLDMFYEHQKQLNQPIYNEEGEDSDDTEDDDDQNFLSSRRGCLASVREILSLENLSEYFYSQIQDQIIFPLLIYILQDKELLFLEEGLNILNLMLFKKKTQISSKFNNFFLMILYCFLGIPQQLANLNISQDYKTMLTNLCVEPDDNMLQNSIGVIRNYIVKLGPLLRQLRDQTNTSYMEYIFNTVNLVHTKMADPEPDSKPKHAFARSDRSIVLTIYVTLIEHKIVNSQQFDAILNNILGWLQNSTKNNDPIFTPIYLELLMVAYYYSPETVMKNINMQFVIPLIFENWERFVYEYQIQRIIIGFCKVIECRQIQNEQMMGEIMKRMIDLVERLIAIRRKSIEGENMQEKMDAQEEAEEDLIAENTHLGLINPQVKSQNEKQEQKYLKECEDIEWDEEYNKFYESPFAEISQLNYLTDVLKNSQYVGLLTTQEQEFLSNQIMNGCNKKY